ncbi:hypothetical protein T8A63_11105 [Sulfitobacter sp. OXR-159]|uniref:hypothetical protein n=1 Tax=Sulfitobacter sp. OXR-159 TaxID=3100174 RepID=UPI002AC971E0|nr:hypothetical protein [Sulfitobacter sp. OXR-159]WPZ28209.1 hypothetical protein T8A63_11105 [Sulfitobacter sp. OXR-159]
MSEVLNCDAGGCGHVEHVGTITPEHVGAACPKCGANLLTQKDWEAWRPIQALLNMARSQAQGSTDDRAEVRVSLHGDRTSIEITNRKPD